MGISATTGLISGINFGDLVSQLVQIEERPILLLQSRKADLNTVSAELSTLSVKLSSLKTASSSLTSLPNFNTNTVSVTKSSNGVDLLSATVDATAVTGAYQVQVNQLAQANSLASQGFVDDDTTAVASAAGTLKLKVGTAGAVTSVTVTTSMTLLQLRDAINNANGSAQASIINDGSGSNPFRLVLTAKNSGVANTVIITDNPTTLDFTNKKVEAAFAKTTNSYAGTVSSNEGNNYTGTTNKTFLVQIVTGGAPGTATYKYSTDGGITFSSAITTQTTLTNYIDGSASSNSTNEGVQIAFGAGSGTLVAADEFTIDVFYPTLQSAQDAVVEIGNLTLARSSNTITDVIQGVTLNLLKADSTEAIDVTVSTDSSGVKGLVDSFISAYNDLIGYLTDQLSFDPDVGIAKPLLGDSTALFLKRQVQSLITSAVPGSSTGLNSLAKLGVTTDSKTAKLSLDDATFQAEITKSLQDVSRLFIGIGVPTNTAIEFVSKTSDTQAGTYGIVVNTAPTRATVLGAHTVPAAGITLAETISVSLFSDATTAGNTPVTAQIIAAAGSTVNDIVNALNSEFATEKMDVSASNNNGTLQIRTTNYGDDYKVQVLSNVPDAADQSGIGTTVLETQGVDIVGTLNGFTAKGVGAVLTSTSGFGDKGLSIKAEVSTTGSFGTITVSSGIADRMEIVLEAAVNTDSGTIKIRQDGISDSLEDLDADIATKAAAVALFEQRTLEKFQRLEVLLGALQSQSQALTSTLLGLANLQTFISNR